MKIGIGIFAKTIGHSRIKTRLAENIGQRMAEEFYSLSVKAVKEVVGNYASTAKDEVSIYWARPSGRYDICTRGLGLGAAMHKVSRQIIKENDIYILIGTDTPQISVETFNGVSGLLRENKESLIFGPSLDGGFYLMAGSKVPDSQTMDSVSYSQSDTLDQLLNLLNTEGQECLLIETLSDVDVVDDLKFLHENLIEKFADHEELLESQKAILDWLMKKNLT